MKGMDGKITRRKLLRGSSAAALCAGAIDAQTAAAVPQTAEEELKLAQKRTKGNVERLAKFPLPMSTEPAFQFRA
jgi:hypothetical protein